MPLAFKGEQFSDVKYFAFGGTGNGMSVNDPLPISDQDIFSIPAGMVITNVSVLVSTALTGTTVLDIGDDDDQNGFVAAATLTAGAVTASNGAYLSGDLEKGYLATGKEIKLDNTTANTAGAFSVAVRGYKI